MAEDANKNTANNGEAATSTDDGSNTSGNNNTSNAGDGDKAQKNSPPATVPYERFKEVNDKLAELQGKGNGQANNNSSSSPSQDSPEDVVLELVGKVPEHLKPEMAAMAKYAKDHKLPVDDVISIFNVKKGHTVPKSEIENFNKANQDAKDSGTGGTANPAVRNDNSSVKALSNDELSAKVNELAASGQI